MRPEVQLKSVIKALTDVVLPAVAPDNTLAQEQGKLAIGLLTLLSQQLPVQYAFDRDELDRLLAYCERLHAQISGGERTTRALETLDAARAAAAVSLAGARTSPKALQQAVRDLREKAGALITSAYGDGTEASRAAARTLTLEMSQAQLLRDRAMLLLQGWEPDPDAIPALDELIATDESHT